MVTRDLPPSTIRDALERSLAPLEQKRRLAVACRIFAAEGFDFGGAGHISLRNPERPDSFWVNPLGVPFSHIRVSDLVLVDAEGNVVEGKHRQIRKAAFVIHSHVHAARPDVMVAAHAHSAYGTAWSTLGRLVEPITQDACIFFEDHGLLESFGGIVVESSEGGRVAAALGPRKALILQNHGLLTVGQSVDEATFWFVALERACQTAVLAESVGSPRLIPADVARQTRDKIGRHTFGWLDFQPMYERIVRTQPDVMD
jgi:ribulose-5-phosphate 4-epimerase/fuculose-1-phosphate aldolase